jgi:hypothetical protein
MSERGRWGQRAGAHKITHANPAAPAHRGDVRWMTKNAAEVPMSRKPISRYLQHASAKGKRERSLAREHAMSRRELTDRVGKREEQGWHTSLASERDRLDTV